MSTDELTPLFRALPLDRAVETLMRVSLAGSDLGALDYAVLSAVVGGACTPTSVSEVLGSPKATVTGWLDGLVGRGLLVRERSTTDGRSAHLRLSEEGELVRRRAREAFGRGYLAFVDEYDGDIGELNQTLDRMTRAVLAAADRLTPS